MQLEKIFTVMGYTDSQKVIFATYMLDREAELWWRGAKSLLASSGIEITWEVFLTPFFDKYFFDSVQNEKEVEFIQLKQRSMTIGQCVSKFDELSKFSFYLKNNPDGHWKATKFEWKLKHEIREKVSTLEIKDFATLVNKCRIA